MLVGQVGIEPTVFLKCLIYSQVSSPSRHTDPNLMRLGGSNRKLLFVCLLLRCFASASLKNRISPLFCGATAVIVSTSYC